METLWNIIAFIICVMFFGVVFTTLASFAAWWIRGEHNENWQNAETYEEQERLKKKDKDEQPRFWVVAIISGIILTSWLFSVW